ncbi:carboxymuconolactone decarboxylase family protein [Smaragdicoccus niigatensis]|uniref:carboxymuconolactone decarboxylase family protein n=1 Tax=Smaragdicoccus niigatensis TaxID=359359 RepID=UPI0003616D0B|nr:carboxymuconolactone decarboxylase family protein [Smaragdicoccus niigatensis]
MAPFLAPIENPTNPAKRLLFAVVRKQMGLVPSPFSVFVARMPLAFGQFYGKVSQLDKKLTISPDLAVLVRSRVNSTNSCEWCMDGSRWFAQKRDPHLIPKIDAIRAWRTSPLFSDAERSALAYATELTENKHVEPETFAELTQHYSEREICDIVWLVASEHLYNINNIGLNIGSDGLCALQP